MKKTFTLQTMPAKNFQYRERLLWLARLRWWAMFAIMLGVGIASFSEWAFVSSPGVAAGAIIGCIFNSILYIRLWRDQNVHPHEIEFHIFFDLLLLTWILAFAGGILNPFTHIYAFHVLLAALLKGKSGGLRAFLMSASCLVTLFFLEFFGVLPVPDLKNPPFLLWSSALLVLLLGIYYLSWVLSTYIRQGEKEALKGHQKATDNLNLLSNALDTLNVGLEIRSKDQGVHFLNPFAAKIQAAKHKAEHEHFNESTGHNFLYKDEDQKEHLIHVLKVNFTEQSQALLYVDRTKERLVQERHFMLEKLATLGRALQGIAHELNTPLSTMQTLAKDIQEAIKDVELTEPQRLDLDESITLIIEESQRCRNLSQLLLQSAPQRHDSEKIGEQLRMIVERSVQLIGMKVNKEGAEFYIEGDMKYTLDVDANIVLQILMNLNQNALRACKEYSQETDIEKPWIVISVIASQGCIEIHIKDKGPGLADIVQERLFEPFVTTHATGGGTGLGLYTSHRLASDFGGELTLKNHKSGGMEAILKIPQIEDVF